MSATVDPVGDPERRWFLGTLVTVHVAAAPGSDAISLLEHRAPHGDSAPMHVHHTEDEAFYVLEGEIRFLVAGRERRAGAGDSLLVPKGIPHTYRVESPQGARWLTVTTRRDFEAFVRKMSRPAPRAELPEDDGPPTSEEMRELEDTARSFGIELVGPPLE